MLLGIHVQTPLHAGTGTALGTIDLPIQRERHTHWPTIAGSSLKGILRDTCRDVLSRDEHALAGDTWRVASTVEISDGPPPRTRREKADQLLVLNELFGPPTNGADTFAGALSVTDARMLAFPVRSFQGVFAWVTCPAVLERLKRDARLAGLKATWQDTPAVQPGQFIASPGSPCVVQEKSIILEEFDFQLTADTSQPIAEWIVSQVLSEAPEFADLRDRFADHFVILSDDDFTHFVRHATEVTARIALNYETKTVKKGALFYQEFLPAESLLYSVVLANVARSGSLESKTKTETKTGGELLKRLNNWLQDRTILQIGGDETTGKGLCVIRLAADMEAYA